MCDKGETILTSVHILSAATMPLVDLNRYPNHFAKYSGGAQFSFHLHSVDTDVIAVSSRVLTQSFQSDWRLALLCRISLQTLWFQRVTVLSERGTLLRFTAICLTVLLLVWAVCFLYFLRISVPGRRAHSTAHYGKMPPWPQRQCANSMVKPLWFKMAKVQRYFRTTPTLILMEPGCRNRDEDQVPSVAPCWEGPALNFLHRPVGRDASQCCSQCLKASETCIYLHSNLSDVGQ